MRGRTFFLIGISVGLAAVPFTCRTVHRYNPRSVVPVVVAAVDMAEGAIVTFEMISQRSVPEELVTSSVIKPDSASYIVNQRLLAPVQAGDPLRWADFERSPRVQVREATRLVSIDVAPSRALAGQLRAQDRVDVLATLTDPNTRERVARTVIEDAQVVEVTPTGVQLIVSAEAAEALVLVDDLGKLTLTLRNPDDESVSAGGRRTTLSSLLRPDPPIRCRYRPLVIAGPGK